jgi:hypothetical protein
MYMRPPRISMEPCKLVEELPPRDLMPGEPTATEGDVVVIGSLLPISGAAALNELELALGGGDVAGVSAMIPLGSETMFIGAAAPRTFAASLFIPQPRELMMAARGTSSRLSAEFPARAVRFMLSLESNSHPREPMAATTSIRSGPSRLPGNF